MQPSPSTLPRRIGLVSCVASKTSKAAPAADLYTSPLFCKARAYVEKKCARWFILSAKYGLLPPDRMVEPYEQTLLTMKVTDRSVWADGVLTALEKELRAGDEVLILAGARYREFLEPALVKRGFQVTIPMKSLPIGRQLQWLTQHA